MATLATTSARGRQVNCASCGSSYSLGTQSDFCPHTVANGSGLIGPSIEHNAKFGNWHADIGAAQIMLAQVRHTLSQDAPPDSFETWIERADTEDGVGRLDLYVRAINDHPAAAAAIDQLPDMIDRFNIISPI
jgi:hypothetical protein